MKPNNKIYLYSFNVWLACLYGLYLKSITLAHNSGYLSLSRALGRDSPNDFDILERISLYQEDIAISLLIYVIFLCCFKWLSNRVQAIASMITATLLIIAYHCSAITFANTGTFLSRDLASDSLLWAWTHPEDISHYISTISLLKIVVSLMTIYTLTLVVSRLSHKTPVSPWPKRPVSKAISLMVSVHVVLILLSSVKPLQASSLHVSATRRIVSSFLPATDYKVVAANESFDDMKKIYATLAQIDSNPHLLINRPPHQTNTAEHKNIFLFILETAPIAVLSHQELNSIFSHGTEQPWYSEHHYATFPYTSDAIFSILTSLYSTPDERKRLLSDDQITGIGWPAVLQQRGYHTKNYAPAKDSFENDNRMYQLTGVTARYFAETETFKTLQANRQQALQLLQEHSEFADKKQVVDKLTLDLTAWEKLKEDSRAWYQNRENFVAIYTPQLGHGPYLQIGNSNNVEDKGKTINRLFLFLFQQFIDELRANGQLEHSVIVITSDHGLRTKTEYPELLQGLLTDISIRVPLLIYSNDAPLGKPLTVNTSHIDIGPTLLHLLDIHDPRTLIQGASIFSENIVKRTIYARAASYLGANTIIAPERKLSCNIISEQCVDLNFMANNTKDPLNTITAQQQQEALTAINQLNVLQQKSISLLLNQLN